MDKSLTECNLNISLLDHFLYPMERYDFEDYHW